MSSLDVDPGLVESILVRFLASEAGKFGFTRAVLGLSGGIDSAVSAALAARAFGPENVLAVMMPYRTSNPDSEGDARTVAEALKLPTRHVDISPMADGYLDAAAGDSISAPMRRGNVMARCRMIVLYDLSVEWNGLVIGTSNKTEILLGYSTQFGDAASALNPLGDLYKHQVVQLAQHLALPAAVIDKPPSADLFEGQTDESELGFSYAEADRLLLRLVDERCGREELIGEGFQPELVDTVTRRIVQNQYKRLPPIVAKLGPRTVGQDFRYLRSWGR
ncbi:MAG: NAD+ synthase [Planctomycetota bacterium]|jgi:NAD+ synthase|nr:NAD(+) synthetase [Planctomycetota bacterium]MDP6368248.1 NAD+ synthase [Planctomycetota bacterium]MDP6520518.1 NAD+ synthase [Planctomycetota bacterium]MDP6837886.1 NAD+ synthase [Planctomycetota bacterium]MDP6954501.1 NAD+ synthase [Planctomycetota bacterium]